MFLILVFLCHLIVPGLSEFREFFSCPSSTTISASLTDETKMEVPIVSKVSISDPNDPELLKTSPCIFKTQSNCIFPVSPGPKFVRLHFYPMSSPGLNISKALFNVSISRYTLLSVSESSYSKEAFDIEYMIKEYSIAVDGHVLNISFTPSSDYSDAYGFVNMIEVVSMPPKLYLGDLQLPLINGRPNQFYSINSKTLETLYRVNVGGSGISAGHDTGLFRSWSRDDGNHLFPKTSIIDFKKTEINFGPELLAQIAPKEVYSTARTTLADDYNLTLSLPVDSGFFYLIRLHLYMESSYYHEENQMVVHIHGSGQEDNGHGKISLIQKLDRDYLVNLTEEYQGMMFLSVSIQPDETAVYSIPILNGLEIFRLSDDSNSLAGPNPFKARKVSDTSSAYIMKIISFTLAGVVAMASVACIGCLICLRLLCYYLKWKQKRSVRHLQSSEECQHFSLAEIKVATIYFSDDLLLGSGGFGKVYKGYIVDGNTTPVAVKRANQNSHQGLNEFLNEITTLSKLRHCHLVSLIGCCMEDNEMILVYNFMAGGTLRDHLYKTRKKPLPWNQRLKICIGAARGLHYLHTGGKQTIIHRDVKTTNILLDENWVAKVSDFGLSKIGPNMMTESETHVSTLVKGSFGYLDPEYYRRRKLTEKSDVYSFGVVLFEVLFARPAVLPLVENEEEHDKVNLAEWAIHCYEAGTLDQDIDPSLHGQINPECLQTFTAIARKCLADKGSDRPSMGEVLCDLELAWQQERRSSLLEASTSGGHGRTNVCIDGKFPPTIDGQKCLPTGNSDPTPGVEFSEIMVPTGR